MVDYTGNRPQTFPIGAKYLDASGKLKPFFVQSYAEVTLDTSDTGFTTPKTTQIAPQPMDAVDLKLLNVYWCTHYDGWEIDTGELQATGTTSIGGFGE